MDRAEFLRQLEGSLAGGAAAKAEIIADYEEHFRLGLADGQTELEIAASLGDPRAIAKAYNADHLVDKASRERSAANIARAVWAVISLSFFNLVFLVGPFFGLVCALIGLWAAGISVTLAGLAVFLVALFSPLIPWFVTGTNAVTIIGASFIGLGATALGALACIGLSYLTIGAYKLVVAYLQFNLKIIRSDKD